MDIRCHKGRCIEERAELEFLDSCLDCTLADEIEKDLIRNEVM